MRKGGWPGQMANPRVMYNMERLDVYIDMFCKLVRGLNEDDADVQDAHANLLIDIRWPDVPRAFAHVLYNVSIRGDIRPLADAFERLVDQAALAAFGTRSHRQIPSWFFQNFECLLASTLHKLIVHFRNPLGPTLSLEQRKAAAGAFNALIDVAKGLRAYVGLDYLSESTGVHVLMSAVQNAKCDFLSEVASPSPRCSALVLADVLAQHILADPNRELVMQSGFCFFARSSRWCAFAKACHSASVSACTDPNAPLERLLREVHEARHPRLTGVPGLFFLASEFLEADASPERAPEVARSASLRAAQRSPIAKRSKPFLRLVKRLVSGSP